MHNTELDKNNTELQKELYIATLIHDLKNPLQAQICSLKLLSEEHLGKISGRQKELLNTLLESCKFLQSMIYSVLDTYKLDNGLIKINSEIIDINKIIELCLGEIRNFSEDNYIKTEYSNFAKTPFIFGDFKLLRRVISNLLNNAVNYSFQNTVLSVLLKDDENNINITVKNTGYEIPKETKEHIFDKYITSNITRKTGFGLGLYLCKKVIEAHNGKILLNCSNNTNEFIIILPKNSEIKDTLKFV